MAKPTKFGAFALAASKRLPAVSNAAIGWLMRQFDDMGYYTPARGFAYCLECGAKLETNPHDGLVCPHCGRKLKIINGNNVQPLIVDYGIVVTTYRGCQVLRLFTVHKRYYKRSAATFFTAEVAQTWLREDGAMATLRLKHSNFMCYDLDRWDFFGPMGLHSFRECEGVFTLMQRYSSVYPRQHIIPRLKRNGLRNFGFRAKSCSVNPVMLMRAVLTDYRAESLLKHGQHDALYALVNSESAAKYWPQMKIAMRHGYIISDWQLWRDTMSMLAELGFDTHSPHYVCPDDLKRLHDRLVARRKAEELRRERERVAEEEAAYARMRGPLVGICIVGRGITVRSLDSVAAVFDEGAAMHHCVYRAGYYKNKDSLLLSATADGKRLETVEVNMKTWKVAQSRGHCNLPSERHKDIVALVEKCIRRVCAAARKSA